MYTGRYPEHLALLENKALKLLITQKLMNQRRLSSHSKSICSYLPSSIESTIQKNGSVMLIFYAFLFFPPLILIQSKHFSTHFLCLLIPYNSPVGTIVIALVS